MRNDSDLHFRTREQVRMLTKMNSFFHRPEERGFENMLYNENPFGGIYRHYPDFKQSDLAKDYLEAICRLEQQKSQLSIKDLQADNLLFTTGGLDAFELIAKTFFEPNRDSVILTPPYFSFFERVLKILCINTNSIPLFGSDFDRLDVPAILNSTATAVILCNPNNPTSTILNKKDLEYLVRDSNKLIIVDEAYIELSSAGSLISLVNRNSNVIVIRTISKAFGMAGLRIGAVIAHKTIINALRLVQLPFNTPSTSARILSNIISSRCISYKLAIDFFIDEREYVAAKLKKNKAITWIGDEGGFITIKLKDRIEEARALLLKSRLQVFIEPTGMDGYIRISVGTRKQNDRLISTLENL